MDAVEFIVTHDRMCKYERKRGINAKNEPCPGCCIPARMNIRTCPSCKDFIKQHPAEAVEIVERWAKEHPRKTRQSEFLKMFPRASMTADGVIAFCPESMDSAFVCPIKERDNYDPECGECRKKYWLEEVEEDD
nr:MAG TPA: hypothetical protein [Caudoviricetes sp.]